MLLETVIQIAMPRSQSLNYIHLLFVSISGRKKSDKLCLELFIRMVGSCEQFCSARA